MHLLYVSLESIHVIYYISSQQSRSLITTSCRFDVVTPFYVDWKWRWHVQKRWNNISRNVRYRTFWLVRPTKTQNGLCIRAVCSEYSLSTESHFSSLAILIAPSEDSDQPARMRMLIWIFAKRTCRKALYCGSYLCEQWMPWPPARMQIYCWSASYENLSSGHRQTAKIRIFLRIHKGRSRHSMSFYKIKISTRSKSPNDTVWMGHLSAGALRCPEYAFFAWYDLIDTVLYSR